MTARAELLAVSDLRKSFGPQAVLTGITMSIKAGEVRAVIGPNGAGKTTFINVITGIYAADAGVVLLDGHDISRARPHRIVRGGMARTYQIASLYPSLTVAENVAVACHAARRFSRHDRPVPRRVEAVEQALDLVGLNRLRGRRVAEISHGDQRLLEIAVTAALRPRLMLLDEPTAGMSPAETEGFVTLVQGRLREACTILLIEHDMSVVMNTADTITVLTNGHVLAEGCPQTIRADQAVQEAYLGSAFAQ